MPYEYLTELYQFHLLKVGLCQHRVVLFAQVWVVVS
jgi:hypothetical protein